MNAIPFSREHLEAYLDEALPPDEMACVEETLRHNPRLLEELRAIVALRDQGVHTLGAIWRRHRLTCATRERLQAYLAGDLSRQEARYVRFHLQVIGCRYCQANLEDLQEQKEDPAPRQKRRRRYFQSSAGRLPRKG